MATGVRGAKRIADDAQASRHRSQATLCRARHAELILRNTPDDGVDASAQRACRNARRCGLLTVMAASSKNSRTGWTMDDVPDPHQKPIAAGEQERQQRREHSDKKQKDAKLAAPVHSMINL
jgi:hypothetical protein